MSNPEMSDEQAVKSATSSDTITDWSKDDGKFAERVKANLEALGAHCPAFQQGQSLERGEGTHREGTVEHPVGAPGEPRWCGGEFVEMADGTCGNCPAPRERHIPPVPSPAKDEPLQGPDEHLAYLGLKAEVDALHEWLGPRTNYPGTSWGRTLVDEVKAKLAASLSAQVEDQGGQDEENEFEENECHLCSSTMMLPFGLEPTKYCNLCAQELVSKYESASVSPVDERSQLDINRQADGNIYIVYQDTAVGEIYAGPDAEIVGRLICAAPLSSPKEEPKA